MKLLGEKRMLGFDRQLLAGNTVERSLTITFQESYSGTMRTLALNLLKVCPKCQGLGGGTFSLVCVPCGGQGRAERNTTLTIPIPPGVNDGASLRLPGEGQPGIGGAPAGDLIVHVEVMPDPLHKRRGDDLYRPITIYQQLASQGGSFSLRALNGQMMTVEIPAGTRNHQQLCLPGGGMPRFEGTGHGNLYLNVTVEPGFGAPPPGPLLTGHPVPLHTFHQQSTVAGNLVPIQAGSALPVQARSPSMFGNYHVLKPLGSGGQAEVYLAKHQYLQTEAAIKLLKEQLSAQAEQAFLREAQTIARLRHPHIVRVLEFGIEQQQPYLVMDYAPQGTLRTRHPEGTQIPLARVVNYVQQIAAALQYAHDQQIVHRDIKPENMLIEANGNLVLSDFGIALAGHTTRSHDQQEAIGTVHYMAPEQIQGQPRRASDQYALAIVVYEWLCGDPPFLGDSSLEIAMQHLSATPPSLRKRVAGVPAAVEKVILRALAKDPLQRFPGVQAFADALQAAAIK